MRLTQSDKPLSRPGPALVIALSLAASLSIACSDDGSDSDSTSDGGDGDGDGGDGDGSGSGGLSGDGDGDGAGGGDGDAPGSGGAEPVDHGTFVGLTGALPQLAMPNGEECSLDSSGFFQCELSLFWDSSPTAALETIAGGGETFCGLESDGTPHCWSDDDSPGLREGPFTAIAVGDQLACGIRPNGKLECWGDAENEAYSPPPDGVFVDVVIDRETACALLAEGDVLCWGRSFTGGEIFRGDFVQISLEGITVCGRTADGEVLCPSGRTADGLAPGPYKYVAGGTYDICGVLEDGSVTCTGTSEISRLLPPAGSWDQILIDDRDACVWNTDGDFACWGLTLGDGGSELMCERHQALLTGTRDESAYSSDLYDDYVSPGSTNLDGYRFVYETSIGEPWSFGLLFLDGAEDLSTTPLRDLPEGDTVAVDKLTWFDGATVTEPGVFYCSASDSTIQRVSDEVLVDFQNLHSLGGCEEGDVVSGGIEHTPDSLTLDVGGVEVETTWGGLGGGYNTDGSGVGTTTMGTGGVLKVRWNADGSIAWAVYLAPVDGGFSGATFCTTEGSVTDGGFGNNAVISLTGFHRVPDCPTETSTNSVQGCIR